MPSTDRLTLVATWKHANKTYRLIAVDSANYILERRVRDAPAGLEMWEQVINTRGLRDAGIMAALCGGIEQVAKKPPGKDKP